jgi:leucyl/phenylalanyl-tRNA--protein transferase
LSVAPPARKIPTVAVPQLDHTLRFPDPRGADRDGLVAIGGDLSVPRLLAAYRLGIFPWPEIGWPLPWVSPPRRAVLRPRNLHTPRRLRRLRRQQRFTIHVDRAFATVIRGCGDPEFRPGTWLTHEMIAAYCALHRHGHAHSVEVWRGEELVAGLYGVAIGRSFSAESMFHRVRDTSKLALVAAVELLDSLGYRWLDCQVPSPLMTRFGAETWPRARFLAELARAVGESPTRPWPSRNSYRVPE